MPDAVASLPGKALLCESKAGKEGRQVVLWKAGSSVLRSASGKIAHSFLEKTCSDPGKQLTNKQVRFLQEL